MDQRREKEGLVILSHFDMHVYVTHILKLGMDQRREKEEVVILSHFNSPAKVGNGSEKRKEGTVILSHFDMHVYATHRLKLGMHQRKEKEGVFILRHHLCNSPPKVWNGSENRKRGSGYS